MARKTEERSKMDAIPPHRREDRDEDIRRTEEGKDEVQEGSEESFPASDPPSSTPGHA